MMIRQYPQLVFSESVRSTQQRYGTRKQGQKLEQMEMDDTRLTEREAEFIAERDSFYVATVGENGWPYVQFRGGPRGFLRVLDDQTLGYADFRGNLQYITTGNLRHDERVALFLIDYPSRRRLKIMARAKVFEAQERPDLLEKLDNPGYKARVERVVAYEIVAFDWNCPQHITPRFTEEELAPVLSRYRERIASLEAEVARLNEGSGAGRSAASGSPTHA